MATTTNIPVTITPEAAARIAQLGIQREVETMIEHTRQTVSGLESIEISAWDDEYEPDQPHLTITGWRPGVSISLEDYRAEGEWAHWFVRAFPPNVLRWVGFDMLYRDEHGR